ncbi:hypothetical protein CAL26_04450 [Bordetella genomosp. 9]|uniref:Uncharacterized protein n=1 Tax=Bordetella genomosp. 9 TaxID=1416803 RepID=A0A261RND6_9BORD|nr:hypothetical protein [Bordetella genomosp. 9]OZI26578.1 hypothetical protein CAL26_04450 [Bordetella genomosp. 9]
MRIGKAAIALGFATCAMGAHAAPDAVPNVLPNAPAASAESAALAAPVPAQENYTLRQALMASDMLSKVDVLCPDGGRDREARRLDELETVARQRLKLSAKALLEALRDEVPPVLMTAEQAVRVVANAGGCKTDALAEWRGRAAYVADTSRQVLAGQARADRQWPRDAALEQPLRITVTGQRDAPAADTPALPNRSDPAAADRSGVWLRVDNPRPAPVRMALLGSQAFVGLCTRLAITGVPVAQGYAPREWLELPPRGTASVWMARDPACVRQARVNVGGVAVIDTGAGPRYWRFLVRGVGYAPAGPKSRNGP